MIHIFCKLFTIILFLHSPSDKSAIVEEIDSLKFMKADSLNCNAKLFWEIVSKGKQAIPYLIERLDDSTLTNQSFHCKDSKLTVGDICYFAIDNIIELPEFYVFHIQFDVIDGDCWPFYYYLFDNKSKTEIKKSVQKWYSRNKRKYKWEKFNLPPSYRSYPSHLLLWDCLERYRVKGRYMYQSNH